MASPACAASSLKSLAASISVTLKVKAVEDGIKLTWTSSNQNVLSGYQAFKQTADKTHYGLVKTTGNTTKTWTDTGVIPGETYSYEVRGFIKDGSTRRFTKDSKIVSAKCEGLLSPSSVILNAGENIELVLIGDYNNDVTSSSEVSWIFDNPSIASVSNGIISGNASGKTRIRARYKGKFFSCAVTVYSEDDYLNPDKLMENLNEEKNALSKLSLDNIDFSYLIEPVKGSSNALTAGEINKLMTYRKGKNTLTYKEAKKDIEIFFYAYKYGYALYNYYGESKFTKAKNACMKAIKGKTKVTKKELINILYKNTMFMVDGHCRIEGLSNVDDNKNNYEYYYSGIYFSKDKNGFYKNYSDGKYYYKSCTEKNASIEPTLTSSRMIMYQLIMNVPVADAPAKSKVTLKNGSGASKTVTATWKKEKDAEFGKLTRNTFAQQGDVFYIDLNTLSSSMDEQQYISSADSARKSKAVIFDIRGNGGGSFESTVKWIERFTGGSPSIPNVSVVRNTAFKPYDFMNNEEFIVFTSSFGTINNDIPVYILTDDLIGSAAEHIFALLRTMKNVAVIGTNTLGAGVSMERFPLFLPNSGIAFDMTSRGVLGYDYENNKPVNIDGKGYKPDVWCESKKALDYTYSLLKKQGYNIK